MLNDLCDCTGPYVSTEYFTHPKVICKMIQCWIKILARLCGGLCLSSYCKTITVNSYC
uniref:Uncharacterized protein n=1 Tax=Anguilla anguilla TaxID=7936 RepID=A0A0E9PZB0_ANGAN